MSKGSNGGAGRMRRHTKTNGPVANTRKNLGVKPQAQSRQRRLFLTEPKGRSKDQSRRGPRKAERKRAKRQGKRVQREETNAFVNQSYVLCVFLSEVHIYKNMTRKQIQRANNG